MGTAISLSCFVPPRYPDMPVGHLPSCPWSSSERSPWGNYHRTKYMWLLAKTLSDPQTRNCNFAPCVLFSISFYWNTLCSLWQPTKAIQLAQQRQLIFLIYYPANFCRRHSLLSTDAMSMPRMIFHQVEPLPREPTTKARLFLYVPNNSILYL